MVNTLIGKSSLAIRSILCLHLVIVEKDCFTRVVLFHLIHLPIIVTDWIFDKGMSLVGLSWEYIVCLLMGKLIIEDKVFLGIIYKWVVNLVRSSTLKEVTTNACVVRLGLVEALNHFRVINFLYCWRSLLQIWISKIKIINLLVKGAM